MVALTTNLGRSVPTPRQVLEVIRPQLRAAAIVGPAFVVAMADQDRPIVVLDAMLVGDWALKPEDQRVSDELLAGLALTATESTKAWARDCAMVFDAEALATFVKLAVRECFGGTPSDEVLDVLALDEGVCEGIGHALRRLAVPLGDDALPTDKRVADAAAAFFTKV